MRKDTKTGEVLTWDGSKDENGDPVGIVSSVSEVGRAFNRSPTTVTNWRYNRGMPVEEDGNFDLSKISQWKKNRKRDPETIDRAAAAATPEAVTAFTALETKRIAEADLARAKAIAANRQNELAAGRMVARHDVEHFFSGFFSSVRESIMAVPRDLEAIYPTEIREECVEALHNRLEIALKTLWNQRTQLSDLEAIEPSRKT